MTALHLRRTKGGFTLIEAMVALTILAVGLLGMLGLQLRAMERAEWGRHSSEAARIVGDKLEELNRVSWGDPLLQPTAWTVGNAVALTIQSPTGAVQQQSFNLQWRVTADAADTSLRHVDVRATWMEKDQRAGALPRRYAASTTRFNN
jgi:prepilin-type N-terminal cleavage/methylation domain-containing protein